MRAQKRNRITFFYIIGSAAPFYRLHQGSVRAEIPYITKCHLTGRQIKNSRSFTSDVNAARLCFGSILEIPILKQEKRTA